MKKTMRSFVILPFLFLALVFLVSCSASTAKSAMPKPTAEFYKEFSKGIYPFIGYNNATDNTIDEAAQAVNNGTSADMEVYSSAGANKRILIAYLIKGELPADAIITKASLTLSVHGVPGNMTITAHEVPEDFLEASSTWNNSGLLSWTAGGNFDPIKLGRTSVTGQTVNIDINPDFVTDCILLSSKEFRVLLKTEEDSSGERTVFYSSDCAIPQYRPKLTIYYAIQ